MSDLPPAPAGASGLDRRSLMARALTLVGAVTIAPDLALAKAATPAKRTLDQRGFSLLSAIADTIVPRTQSAGAVDAKVPASFDGLLTEWAAPQRRADLIQAMTRIDAKAKAQNGKAFAELDPAARTTLLTAYDADALKNVPRTKPLTGLAAMMAGPSVADPVYYKLKELIVTLYYMSEPALTQELSYEHSPGEWKPSIPVTPETRPAAGGMF